MDRLFNAGSQSQTEREWVAWAWYEKFKLISLVGFRRCAPRQTCLGKECLVTLRCSHSHIHTLQGGRILQLL
jgi:hypothetical protein